MKTWEAQKAKIATANSITSTDTVLPFPAFFE